MENVIREMLDKVNLHIKHILKVIKSKQAYQILDDSAASGTSFQAGGCWILADALSMRFNLPLYVVVNTKKNVIEHFMVQYNNVFLDSDGIQSYNAIINKIAKYGFYDTNDLIIIPYDDKLNHHDIVRDTNASKQLLHLLY